MNRFYKLKTNKENSTLCQYERKGFIMAISAQDVKNLREKTGAGMMDCKKALNESEGDFEKAVEYLKKAGLAKAVKKSGRVAAEGLIFSKVDGNEAVLLELNCETDFVAKNDQFIEFGKKLADFFLEKKPASLEEALTLELEGNAVKDKITDMVSVIGENISLRRVESVKGGDASKIGGYNHMDGKIVVLVEMEGEKISDELIKDLGMQIAAMSPQYIDKTEVPSSVLEKEKAFHLEQMQDSGKPAEILEKIVQGKLNKFASEMSLLQQAYVKDTGGKKTVEQHIKEIAPGAKVKKFFRYAVGEGIEKKEDDFASEVAKMVQ